MVKKKAIIQDFKVEIRKSINRFFSILLIVALGVAFFAGIRSTEPDMRLSADRFYDDSKLMDIRIVSTMGLTGEDLAAVSQVDGIAEAEAAYSVDALCDTSESEIAVKVISETKRLNLISLAEGRMPGAVSECLADKQFLERTGYKIGDKIRLRSGTSEDIKDSMKVSEFTIVGSGTSACYLSLERGGSSIGNGELNGFLIVPPEAFDMEVYTEIYASADGAKELTAYTAEYDDTVESSVKKVEAISDVRREARYRQILKEAEDEIGKAETELSENETDAVKELNSAQIKLNDGKEKIRDGSVQLEDGREELNKGKAELEENRDKLTVSREQLTAGKEELRKAEADIEDGMLLLQQKEQEYQDGIDKLNAGYASWNESMSELDAGMTDLKEKKDNLSTALADIQKQKEELEPVKSLYPDEWQAVLDAETELLANGTELEAAETELEKNSQELNTAKAGLDTQQDNLDAAGIKLKEEKQKLEDAKVSVTDKKTAAEEAEKKIEDGFSDIKQAETEIQEKELLLSDKEQELNSSKATLADKELEYKEAVFTAKSGIDEGRKKIADAKEEMDGIDYPEWYVLDRNSIQTYVEYGQDSERIGNIGNVFPVIFFLVAALVSLTTMTRMVEEGRTQIGTYKALGYRKSQVAGKFILYAFLASIIGSVLGAVAGEKLLPKIIITAYKILYNNLPGAVTPINLFYAILSTVIAVLCTTLAAMFACYKELMAPPSELMRPASPKSGKRVMLERLPLIWKHLNFTQKSTIRNLFRYKKRFFMTIIGIGGCMALLLVGFGLKDSISAMSDIQYVELWHQDASITIDDKATAKEERELSDYLKADSRIKDFMLVKENTVDAGYGDTFKSAGVIVPENIGQFKAYVTFRDRLTHEGRNLTDDGVIITEKLASLLGVAAGDTIYIKDSELSRTEVRVTGIIENYMMHYIFMSPAVYEKLYGEKPDYNRIYTIDSENAQVNGKELASDLLKLSCVKQVSFTTELTKRIDDMLTSLNLVVYVLIISAGLLAFVVLYNLNNININERQRELATLKVLGFQDTEVAAYVYRENILLTVIGAAVGIFLGILLHRFVILTSEIDILMFGRRMKLLSYLLSLLFTLGFSLAVNFAMYYKLKKIDMVESLKSIE